MIEGNTFDDKEDDEDTGKIGNSDEIEEEEEDDDDKGLRSLFISFFLSLVVVCFSSVSHKEVRREGGYDSNILNGLTSFTLLIIFDNDDPNCREEDILRFSEPVDVYRIEETNLNVCSIS